MTPTKDMIAMAERIARGLSENGIYVEARKRMLSDMTGQDIDYHLIVVSGERAALTAIREVLDQTSAWLDGDDPISGDHIVSTIRNGEHLR